MQTIKHLNKMQVPTWEWLKVNDTKIEAEYDTAKEYNHEPLEKIYNNIFVDSQKQEKEIKQPIITKDIKEYTKSVCNHRRSLLIPAGKEVEEPIVMHFELNEENPFLADWIDIEAQKGSKATVVLVYKSEKEAQFHTGYTHLNIEEEADIKLIMVQMLSEHQQNADAIEAVVEENGNASIVLVELGSAHTVGSCNVQLKGNGSCSDLNGVYVGKKAESIDLNYRIEYEGKDTVGDITVKGVLLDQSRKVLKSTLDFLRGASNAKGREEESVIALSAKAVNISCPLLLCGEDNVEGQHATSTGRPDPNKLFYLMSRGLTEQEAKALIVEASIKPILDKISNNELREEIAAIIGGAIQNES